MTDGQKAIPDAGTAVSGYSLSAGKTFREWLSQIGEDDAIAELCDYIVDDGNLAGFAREKNFSYTTVQRWIDADQTRVVLYARACEARADVQAEKIMDVSRRDCRMPITNDEGKVVGYKVDTGAVQQAKLESDNLKWLAAKAKPRKYGEKLELATPDLRGATDEALMAKAQPWALAWWHRRC